MERASQERFASGLEKEWIVLFNCALAHGPKSNKEALQGALSVLIVEIETLLFLTPHEKCVLSTASALLNSNRVSESLVKLHPLIHSRAARNIANFASGAPNELADA